MLRPNPLLSGSDAGAASEKPPSSPPRRERNAAATKQRLLDAAEREFAARGFPGARLREIADGAGVQPALIHHYFVDKRGLYRAVLDRAFAPTSTASWTLLESSLDLESLVSGFVDMLLKFHSEHQNLLLILRHEALSGSTVLTEVMRERTRPIFQAVASFIEERQQAGEVRADIDPWELVVLSLSMIAHPFADAELLSEMLPGSVPRDPDALEKRRCSIVTLLLAAVRPAP
jgi:AcrR family transcriptional regulator